MAQRENEFDISCFVNAGHEQDPGEWGREDRALFQAIREALPEIASWGDLALGVAWGSFSQDVWLQSWLDRDPHQTDRSELLPFLAYIHYHGTKGEPPSWGIPIEDLVTYAREHGLS